MGEIGNWFANHHVGLGIQFINYRFDVDIRLIVLVWIASIVAGACAGSGKSAAWTGAILGTFLGPLGVIAALGLDEREQCPRCTGRIDGFGEVCQHCRQPLHWDPNSNGPSRRDAPPATEAN
jgi:hypothetical protein